MSKDLIYEGTLAGAKHHFLGFDSELDRLIADFGPEGKVDVVPMNDGRELEAWMVVNGGESIDPSSLRRVYCSRTSTGEFRVTSDAPDTLIGPKTSTQLTGAPLNAEFLFHLFMTPQNCDALVGDLEERYKLIHKKFGRRRANFWYWTQTVKSLGPIIGAWGKKVAMKPALAIAGWAVAKGLVGHDSWLAVIVELWKRVRS